MSNGTHHSCPPNDDGILSTGANIFAILIFIYALSAGVLVYTQSIRDSTRKMEETIRDLQFSHNEFQAMKLSFSAVRCKMDNSTDEQVLVLGKTFLDAAHDFDRRLRELMGSGAWIDRSLDRTPTSLLRLRDRNRFAFKQVNYANMTGDKDRAMESLRRAKERLEANLFGDFKKSPHCDLTTASRFEHYEASQHRKQQEAALQQQYHVLKAINRRMELLEARQGEGQDITSQKD